MTITATVNIEAKYEGETEKCRKATGEMIAHDYKTINLKLSL
jgi:hypothetical protein